jgi:hypothetical protein
MHHVKLAGRGLDAKKSESEYDPPRLVFRRGSFP